MNPLRVGVIGLGAFGESHIRAWRGLPNVDLAAVSSRSADRANEIGDRYDITTRYNDHAALITDPSIQAVSITTAESEHRELAIAALQVGKHVLVEKPIASTMDDARAMEQAAREADTILMPGHILRFNPAYAQLRDAAANGEFGRLVAMHARRNRPQSLIATHSRVHPALITAIHDIDIMLWIAQSPVQSVFAVDRIADRNNGAHGLWGMIEFESGLIATIETSWLMPGTSGTATDDAFHITGMTGMARIQLDTPPLRLWTSAGADSPDVSYEPALHGVITGALRDELAHFAQCALTNTPSSIVTPQDGVNALALVLALIESAQARRPVTPSTVA